MFKSFLYAVAFFVAIAGIVAFAVAKPIEEIKPPLLNNMEIRFCTDLDDFALRMEKFDGRLIAGDDIGDSAVFLVQFPDDTFGLFLYEESIDQVCVIDIGTFTTRMPVGIAV